MPIPAICQTYVLNIQSICETPFPRLSNSQLAIFFVSKETRKMHRVCLLHNNPTFCVFLFFLSFTTLLPQLTPAGLLLIQEFCSCKQVSLPPAVTRCCKFSKMLSKRERTGHLFFLMLRLKSGGKNHRRR